MDDDERLPMTAGERTVVAYLVAVVLTSGVYLTLMATRLRAAPAAEVEWVVPMLWTIGASTVATVVVGIVLALAGTVAGRVAAARRAPGATPDLRAAVPTGTDVRDEEIGRLGDRAGMRVLAVGVLGALVLAMLDADSFWIGNLLFLLGTVGAVVETTTKLRLYRRGF